MTHRLRNAIPLAAVAMLLSAQAATAGTVTGRSADLTATMHAGSHHPTCKQMWPVTVTASLHGKPARAKAFYQFLFNGTVVSTQYPFSKITGKGVPYHFRGHFYDNTFGPFGSLAVGEPITVRTVVIAAGHTVRLDYAVKVRKVSGCKAIH